MYNNFEHKFENKRYVIFCAIAGIIAFSTQLSNLISDSDSLFHEGEYVGLLVSMRAFYAGKAVFPLLIHGAMDYIPSTIASFLYGDGRVIVGTRLINTIIIWVCWVLFLDLCYFMISKKNQRVIWMGIVLVIFCIITPKLNSQALIVQQAFIGTRDLFIITTVWCFAQYTNSIKMIRDYLFITIGTVSAVIAFFWSYDRGVMALAFLGIILVGIMINKKVLEAVLLIIAACLSLLVLDYLQIFGSLIDTVHNVIYWARNSAEIFGINIGSNSLPFMTMTLVFLFCAATTLLAFAEIRYSDGMKVFLITGILAIQILLIKTVMNRPGMPRLSWAVWPSILMMLYFASRRFVVKYQTSYSIFYDSTASPIAPSGLAYKVNVTILLMALFSISPSFFPISWYGSFIKNILEPKFDREIVSAEVNNLSYTLRKFNDPCVLGWNNEGVVALLTKKSFCTQYPYAIYVSKDEESNYLQQLMNASPSAIVFDVTGPSMMDIDKRSMSSRLPNVNRFIQNNYPYKQQVGRYLIVSKK